MPHRSLNRRPQITVGPFDLEDMLGKGGMGTVWRGRYRPDGTAIALKLLHRSLAWGGGVQEVFAREVRAVASLHHPAIVHVLDLGAVSASEARSSGGLLIDGAPWMVMELCSGGTLFDYRGFLDWPRLRRTLLTLLDALAHAHARGVIHRDIKPGNVLIGTALDDRPGLKLTDFGIAHVNDPQQLEVPQEEAFAGSPAYCAPEQLLAESRHIGPWTDLYAIGCLAWTMATGEPPYGSCRPLADLVAAHVGGVLPPFEPLDPMPAAFVDWLHHVLSKMPEDRFQCAADAAWALRELAAVEPEEELSREWVPAGAAAKRDPQTHPFLSEPENAATEASTTSAAATRVDVTAMARTAASQNPTGDCKWPDTTSGVGPGPLGSAGPPPLPEDWRRADSPPPPRLLSAGLGLYASRAVPLVGRLAERHRIWGALHDVVREGTIRTVVVSGPAGVGKSRLVEWVAQRAEELGAASVLRVVHGSPSGPADGLAPMLRRWLRLQGLKGSTLRKTIRRWLKRRAAHEPYLEATLAELIEPGNSREDSDGVRVDLSHPEQRWHALSELLLIASAERPVVLWLDDLQWGSDTRGFANYLVHRRQRERRQVLVLATVRSGTVATSKRTEEELDRLRAATGSQALDLKPLDDVERSELVGELLGLDSGLAQQVDERTAGNPLFALQLVGDWVRRGVLQPSAQGFVPSKGASLQVPDDIHDLWRGRFEDAFSGATPDVVDAVATAAALGIEVDVEQWERASNLAPSRLAEIGERLSQRGLVTPVAGGGWRFVHGMARESLLRSALEQESLPRIQSACADAVTDLDDAGSRAQKGRHLLAAERWAEASAELKEAIEALARRGDVSEATDLTGPLLDALRAQGKDAHSEPVLAARLRRLEFDRVLGHCRKALRHDLQELADEAQEAGVLAVLVGALTARGKLLRDGGELPEGVLALRQAYDLGAANNLDEVTAKAAIGLAWALHLAGDQDTAADLFGHAASILGRLGDMRGLTQAWLGLCDIYKATRKHDKARAFGLRGLQAAESSGYLGGVADACTHLASVELVQNSGTPARQWLERARQAALQIGDDSKLGNVLNLLGEVSRKEGDICAAEHFYREALPVFERTAQGFAALVRLNLAFVLMLGARWSEARLPLELSRQAFKADGREALVQISDILLLTVFTSLKLEAEFRLCLKRVQASAGSWKRPADECSQALVWAVPAAERAGWSGEAKSLRGLQEAYQEALGQL